MTVFVQDPDLTIHVGDVRDVLPTLEPESVDCVATSPPFYGLRDYGTGTWEGGDPGCDHSRSEPRAKDPTSTLESRATNQNHEREPWPGGVCGKCGARRADRQIGLEATPDEWAAELVTVFRECRRILRPHGTLWVECGDSYGGGGPGGQSTADDYTRRRGITGGHRGASIKPKDLLGQPWLLAFALRADGWWLRQCITWFKPNCMPESVRDRCTTAHSYIFLLAKQPRYWFDGDAIAEPHAEPWRSTGREESNGNGAPDDVRQTFREGTRPRIYNDGGKNARSVWTIPTRGYPGAHFATWPEALAERIILAGCPEKVCGTCGAPRERIVEASPEYEAKLAAARSHTGSPKHWTLTDENVKKSLDQRGHFGRDYQTTGWTDCGHDSLKPGVVLDPFFGAGTTGLVARRLGRRCVGVELNEEYARMAAERCSQLSLLA